jgi:toxin-antitoxin system PIN domain toxin
VIVDANLLLYAKVADYPQHAAARAWLDDVLSGPERVGLPWQSLLAFIRIGTNPRVFASPMPIADAWGQVERWLTAPAAWIPVHGAGHPACLKPLLLAGVSGPRVSDADLAALAIEHGVELCSTDGDFARFAGLRWRNPIAP